MPEPIEASWLAVRRAADERARATSAPLVELLAAHVTSLVTTDGIPARLAVVDVGAGTGANQEWLAPQLQQRLGHAWVQDWHLLDHDESLLAQARPSRHAYLANTSHVGGVEEVSVVLVGLPRPRVVTCSALLDLMTGAQIDALVQACVDASEAGLWSLSVTGEVHLDPTDANDALVADLFNRHQRGGQDLDTGTHSDSPLGPDGWRYIEQGFTAAGWTVELAATDWHLGPGDEALTRRLLTERAAAARSAADGHGAQQRIDAWLTKRLSDIDDGQLKMRVDHADVLALPPRVISVQTSSPRA